MNVPEQMKQAIRESINDAIRDFNEEWLGVIEKRHDGSYGIVMDYPLIEIGTFEPDDGSQFDEQACADKRSDMISAVQDYVSVLEKRIYDTLYKRLNRPFKPHVEIWDDCGEFKLELGYIINAGDVDFIRSLEECDSDSDADEEDEWMDVYNVGLFAKFCKNQPQLQKYADCTYYQCWGGGPEGGYLLYRTCERGWDDVVYRVNRTWGEPFTVERVSGATGIEVQEIDTDTGTRIRILY